MKFIIQIFVPSDGVGNWRNTNWGGDDSLAVQLRANEIAASWTPDRIYTRVRVCEVLLELDCKELQDQNRLTSDGS